MNDILDHESEDIPEYDGNLFIGVLTNPRCTFRYLHEHAYDKYIWKLLIFSGIVSSFDTNFLVLISQDGAWEKIFKALSIGGFITVIISYISAFLISGLGKIFKGKEGTDAVLRVLAYSMIPSFLNVIFILLMILITYIKANPASSSSGFSGIGSMFSTSPIDKIGQILMWGEFFIPSIWSMLLITIGISEIQKFPLWKAFLNVFIIVFVLFFLIGVLGFIFVDLFF